LFWVRAAIGPAPTERPELGPAVVARPDGQKPTGALNIERILIRFIRNVAPSVIGVQEYSAPRFSEVPAAAKPSTVAGPTNGRNVGHQVNAG
jgi:hypothetical protein